jgi:hypothetical protein
MENNKMFGTCVFKDNDGELKSIDINKVIALVEVTTNAENSIINFKTTKNCSEVDEAKLKEFLKSKTDFKTIE